MCMEMLKTVEEKLGITLNDADTVTIPRTEYERLKSEVERLKEMEQPIEKAIRGKGVGVLLY